MSHAPSAWLLKSKVKQRLRRYACRFNARLRAARLVGQVKRRRSHFQHTILVGLIEHFGDIIACEPVIRYLVKTYPDKKVVFCTHRRYVDLVDSHPEVTEVIQLENLAEWIYFSKRAKGLFADVIDLHVNHRTCPKCDVRLDKTAGNLQVDVNTYYNFGCILHAFSEGAGISKIIDGPQLFIPGDVTKRINSLKLPTRFLTAHQTSNEASRNWTAEKWQELINRIKAELGYAIVLIGTHAIMQSADETADIGVTGLLDSAEIIRRSALFIGVDSGPAHLANAVKTPGVILLGTYRAFKKYCPYSGGYADGSNATLVYQEDAPAAQIAVDRVFKIVRERLAASVEKSL